jgi:cupin superfamily acireductone dioxygenase involved in methionine salvage
VTFKDEDEAEDASRIHRRPSNARKDVEAELQKMGISSERRITVMNLENSERHYFDDYLQAIEFLKEKKGRWYLATPGIRDERDKAIKR